MQPWENSLRDFLSKNPLQKRAGEVAQTVRVIAYQVWDPEFKPQSQQNKTKKGINIAVKRCNLFNNDSKKKNGEKGGILEQSFFRLLKLS
jgi:hypothetical protein